MARFSVNISGWKRRHPKIEKQVRFATARALTLTARAAQQDVTAHLGDIFDRPNPFTQRAVAFLPATRETLVSWVIVKDQQAQYLAIQETGGVRQPRPGAPVIVPVNIRRNVYGNIARGAIGRARAKPNTFFVGRDETPRTAHLAPGLYQRFNRPKGRRKGRPRLARPPKLLAALHEQAQYRPRFNFRSRVLRVVRDQFGTIFAASLRVALASAR
jgi:hypothetical protein